jgi:hypothetical protein
LTKLEFLNSDPRFFGGLKYSPLVVTTKFCKKCRVTIWGLNVKICKKMAKFVLKNGIVTLVGLFAIFQLARETFFYFLIFKNYFSQTISKYPSRVTRVTILEVRERRPSLK